MFKKMMSFLNKPKEKRLAQKEEIRKKLPKKTFSRKFYGFTKDLKNETVVLKLPTEKILYQKEGKRHRAEMPIKFLKNLKRKFKEINILII